MKKTLICNVNLFTLNQNIYISYEDGSLELIDEPNGSANLISSIPYYCDKYDINYVQLVGPTIYTNVIKDDILNNALEKYSNKNIIIDCMETLE